MFRTISGGWWQQTLLRTALTQASTAKLCHYSSPNNPFPSSDLHSSFWPERSVVSQSFMHQAWIPTTPSPLRTNNTSAPNPLCWLRQRLGDAARILPEWQQTKVVSAWAGTWLSAISKSMILQDADLGQRFLLATVKESTRANCIRAKPSSQTLFHLKLIYNPAGTQIHTHNSIASMRYMLNTTKPPPPWKQVILLFWS